MEQKPLIQIGNLCFSRNDILAVNLEYYIFDQRFIRVTTRELTPYQDENGYQSDTMVVNKTSTFPYDGILGTVLCFWIESQVEVIYRPMGQQEGKA